MQYWGIDPGTGSGCLTVIKNPTAAHVVQSFDFKDLTMRDIYALFKKVAEQDPQNFAMLEKLSPIPGRGGKSMLTFWTHYGSLQMALTVLNVPFELVAPQTWQKVYGLLGKRQKKNEAGVVIKSKDVQKKTANKEAAEKLFPIHKVTYTNADSLLIAWYGVTHFPVSGDSINV